jgi:hypothetical protein
MSSGDNNRKHPSLQDLEVQLHNVELKETLTNLDRVMTQLSTSITQMNNSTKLDEIMQKLIAQFGDDRQRINFEFEQLRNQMQQAEGARAHNEMSKLGHESAVNNQLRMSLEQQKFAYNQTELPAWGSKTLMSDAATAGAFRTQTAGVMSGHLAKYSQAGYYGSEVTNPYFNTTGDTLSPMQYKLAESQYVRDLAQSGDPKQMRDFTLYQKGLYQDTQKAVLNQHISEALGADGGMTRRGDFQGMVLPSVSNFAEGIGSSLDEAASVIKQLRDLRVISSDIKHGSGMDVVNAVKEATMSINAVKGLIKSNDIREIVETARNLTNIGNGSFQAGYYSVAGDPFRTGEGGIQSRIIGPFGDPQQSLAATSAYSAQYENTFGSGTLAAMQSGAWDYRTRNLLGQYATGDHLNYVGDPRQAAGPYMSTLTSRAAGLSGLLRYNGGGYNVMAGASNLADQAADDPLGFYLNTPRNMHKASRNMTGQMAGITLRQEVDFLQKEFGLNKDEALLSVMGGDASGVDAYKEVESARSAYADDFENQMQAGKYASAWARGQTGKINFGRYGLTQYDSAEAVMSGVGSSGWGQVGMEFLNVGRSIKEGAYGMIPTYEAGRDAALRGFEGVKRTDFLKSADVGMERALSRDENALLPDLVNIMSTTKAAVVTKNTLEKIIKAEAPIEFNQIKRILTMGLEEYRLTDNVSQDRIERIASFIANLDVKRAASMLLPTLDPEDPLFKLIQLNLDPGKLADYATSMGTAMYVNTVGALREAGMSMEGIKEVTASPSGTFKRMADFIHVNSTVSEIGAGLTFMAAGTALGTAASNFVAPVIGTPAGAVVGGALGFGVQMIGAENVADALEGVQGISDYMHSVVGKEFNIKHIQEFLEEGGPSSAYENELKLHILWTRGSIDPDNLVEWFTVKETIRLLLSRMYMSYASAIAENKSKKPLEDRELEAVTNATLQGIDLEETFRGGDGVVWARTVAQAINDPNSEVGKLIRAKGSRAIRSVSSVMKQVDDLLESSSVGFTAGVFKAAVGDMQNLVDKVREEGLSGTSNLLTAMSTGSNLTKDLGLKFQNLDTMMANTAKNEEARSAAQDIIASVKTAFIDKNYEAIKDINVSDINKAESALGKDFAAVLKKVVNMKDGKEIENELAPLLDDRFNRAEKYVDSMHAKAQDTVNYLEQILSIVLNDGDLSEKVKRIGELLSPGLL